MKRLVIKKGWYWSAGKRFDWMKDGFAMAGVGIAQYWLKENRAIIVNIDKQDYHLDCWAAIEFINKYKSFETIGSSLIGYISKDLLNKVAI